MSNQSLSFPLYDAQNWVCISASCSKDDPLFDIRSYPARILIRIPAILTDVFSGFPLFLYALKLPHSAACQITEPDEEAMSYKTKINLLSINTNILSINTNHPANKLKKFCLWILFRGFSGSTLVRQTDSFEFLGRRLQFLHWSSQASL